MKPSFTFSAFTLTLFCLLHSSAYTNPQSIAWMNEPWTKTPEWMPQVANEITPLYDSSIQTIADRRNNVRSQALQHPKVHRLAFEWIVCEYFLQFKTPPNTRLYPAEALKYADSCGSFDSEEYAYWRFLLESQVSKSTELVAIGQRLSARRPNSDRVYVMTANLWKHHVTDSTRSQYLDFVKQIEQGRGRTDQVVGLEADMYYLSFYAKLQKGDRDPNLREKGIKAWYEFLTLSQDATSRKVAQRRLQYMQNN